MSTAKVRERKTCTSCGSLRVRKRKTKKDYVCERCGFSVTTPKYVSRPEVLLSGGVTRAERKQRLDVLKAARENNPGMTPKDAIFMGVETPYYITRYWDKCSPEGATV
jgi:ribosomal protein L37AE/L43A